MSSLLRGPGGFPLTAMAMAVGTWILGGQPAMAQCAGTGGGCGSACITPLPGPKTIPIYAYGGPAYGNSVYLPGADGLPPGTPGFGTFGLGYPGFGLDYTGCRSALHQGHFLDDLSVHNWGAYVQGKECMDPYLAYPYDSPAALGFWPPYSAPVATPGAPRVVNRAGELGIEEEPVVNARGARGMKVARVDPDTPAARAGIQAGDVVYSINGYLTQQRGNLAWIMSHAAPRQVLEIKLRAAGDGPERVVMAQMSGRK